MCPGICLNLEVKKPWGLFWSLQPILWKTWKCSRVIFCLLNVDQTQALLVFLNVRTGAYPVNCAAWCCSNYIVPVVYIISMQWCKPSCFPLLVHPFPTAPGCSRGVGILEKLAGCPCLAAPSACRVPAADFTAEWPASIEKKYMPMAWMYMPRDWY